MDSAGPQEEDDEVAVRVRSNLLADRFVIIVRGSDTLSRLLGKLPPPPISLSPPAPLPLSALGVPMHLQSPPLPLQQPPFQ